MNALNRLMNPAAVGQSFQQGLDLGQQRRGEMESRNALSALAANPNDADAMRNLAFYNPQAAQRQQAINQRDRAAQQESQQKAMTAQLVRAAMAGDEAALDELAVVNRAAWKDINADQQEQIVRESETLGQAALDVLQVPFEQRQGRIIQYAQQLPQYAEQINELAFLPQEQQDLALRGVVIDARMVGKLHQMEKPQAFNVGPGEGRYERNPRTGGIKTIVQPNLGGAPTFSPVPQGQGPTVVRTGRDASGRRVVQLSDGTIQYAD